MSTYDERAERISQKIKNVTHDRSLGTAELLANPDKYILPLENEEYPQPTSHREKLVTQKISDAGLLEDVDGMLTPTADYDTAVLEETVEEIQDKREYLI